MTGGALLGLWSIFIATALPGESQQSLFPIGEFEGSQSCATSGCHGGGEGRNEYVAFMNKDVHRRFVSTLTRSGFLIADTPLSNAECTVCHAPMAPLIGGQPGQPLFTDGFSCETCHGPAKGWLRSHTRYDYSHAQRVAAGLRDLSTSYAQANNCVACHQNIDSKFIENGHPEWLFDLDGQLEREPPHWPAAAADGAAQWLTGQAVALREMSWHLSKGNAGNRAGWEALTWLLSHTPLPGSKAMALDSSTTDPGQVKVLADTLAKKASGQAWSADDIRNALRRLTATASQFADAGMPKDVHIRRAQRLAVAVERLVSALENAGGTVRTADEMASLNRQIRDGARYKSIRQMRSQFDPRAFSDTLEKIQAAL